MIQIEWNEKKLNSFYNKMDKIAVNVKKGSLAGIKKATEETQKLALQLKRGSNKGILIELLDTSTNKIKGRVYTDSKNFPYLVYLEFGTGIYADPEGGGSRAKRIPWYVHVSMADLSRYGYPVYTSPFTGEKFYVVAGAHPHPYMRPAGFKMRYKNIEIIRTAIQEMIKEAVK